VSTPPESVNPPQALRVVSVSKSFNGLQVLDCVSLEVGPGEIVGLVGANGSGKSTLAKIITGVYTPDAAELIEVGGCRLDGGRPLGGTQRSGVRVVHQEAPVIPTMTIAEYVGLVFGFPVVAGAISMRRLRRITSEMLGEVGVALQPTRKGSSLTGGERAGVQLALALHSAETEAELLILDEATAALPDEESAAYLARVRAVAGSGVGVLMITHRLGEVESWCDRVVVLSDGRIVHECRPQEASVRMLIEYIMGPHVQVQHRTGSDSSTNKADDASSLVRSGRAFDWSHCVLEVEGLTGDVVQSVSLQLAHGEILGVSGRPDSGVGELLRLLTGIERPVAGTVRIDGEPVGVGRHPKAAIDAGLVYVSANRLEEGGFASLSVAENLTMPLAERYWRTRRRVRTDIDWAMATLDIVPPDPMMTFGSLSGGNQQKVLLARWLLLKPKVLVLDDPTQGIDPGTRELLFSMLLELRDQGVGVIIHSTEPEQLARLSDRVLIMHAGKLGEQLVEYELSEKEIGVATFG
jgi:ABC-type sugar transport system ATPase subunit